MKKNFGVFNRAEEPTKATWGAGGRTGDIAQLIGCDVLDKTGEKIGTLECLWEDETKQPAFLGVRTGWLGFGKIHVVPAYSAERQGYQTLRLPFSAEIIRSAPSYPSDAEISDASQREIYNYYRQHGTTMPEPRFQTERRAGAELKGQAAGAKEQADIPLSEEEMKVGKRQVEIGGVRIRKIVRTEPVHQQVNLRREEVVVERVPAGQRATGEHAFQGEDVYIPLRAEEPVVEKEARVREEVRVRKQGTTEQRTVSGDVRKEDVEIEKEGAAKR